MNIKKNLITLIIFIMLISAFLLAASLEYRRQEIHSRENMANEVAAIGNNLYTIVESRMINAHALAGLIEVKKAFTKNDYEVFAKKIFFESHSAIKSITFIEDTTIRYIYPSDQYESSVGSDLSLIEDQKDLIELSKKTGKSVITPKFKLVEGGEGVVIRVPLFIDDNYKGQVSLAFDYEELIEAIGVNKSSENFFLKIDVYNEVSEETIEIWTNFENANNDYSFSKTFKLEDSKIIVYARAKKSLFNVSMLFYFLIIFGSAFSLYASYLVYKQFQLSAQLLDANVLLSEKAIHDELTGLLNRRAFFEETTKKINDNSYGSIAIMDLNNFKYINDLYGHSFGDNLLVDTGEFLRDKYKDYADIYRIGGDEFAIVFSHDKLSDYEFQKLRYSLNLSIARLSESLKVDAAIGLIRFPENGMDIHSLFLKADLALQASKKTSNNTLVSYSEILLDEFSKKAQIAKTIEDSLKNNGFELYYQPIYSSKNLEIESFEALVRLKSREYNPDEFIIIAEETQLIVPLGYWIIEEVFRSISSIYSRSNNSKEKDKSNIITGKINFSGKSVAINISSVQLYDSNFIPRIIEMLDTYNLNPSTIKFEITESVFLHKSQELNESINKLRDLGILISLDDFGTGYSSVNYLTYLPLDIVKLDKTLKDKFIDEDYHNVLSGIITMIHGLNMKVVVEGIETEYEKNIMQDLNCDYLQGYYMSRPIPYDTLCQLMLDD